MIWSFYALWVVCQNGASSRWKLAFSIVHKLFESLHVITVFMQFVRMNEPSDWVFCLIIRLLLRLRLSLSDSCPSLICLKANIHFRFWLSRLKRNRLLWKLLLIDIWWVVC
jgi:hypothetical protein